MPATYWPPAPTRYPAFMIYFISLLSYHPLWAPPWASRGSAIHVFLVVINDQSLGTEIQLTIFSIQLDCVLIIKLILAKSTVNSPREILKLEMWASIWPQHTPSPRFPSPFYPREFFKTCFRTQKESLVSFIADCKYRILLYGWVCLRHAIGQFAVRNLPYGPNFLKKILISEL